MSTMLIPSGNGLTFCLGYADQYIDEEAPLAKQVMQFFGSEINRLGHGDLLIWKPDAERALVVGSVANFVGMGRPNTNIGIREIHLKDIRGFHLRNMRPAKGFGMVSLLPQTPKSKYGLGPEWFVFFIDLPPQIERGEFKEAWDAKVRFAEEGVLRELMQLLGKEITSREDTYNA